MKKTYKQPTLHSVDIQSESSILTNSITKSSESIENLGTTSALSEEKDFDEGWNSSDWADE